MVLYFKYDILLLFIVSVYISSSLNGLLFEESLLEMKMEQK